MTDLDDLDVEKKIPTEPRKVLGIFGNTEYECCWCGETENIRPLMNMCPWCGQLFKWE